MAELARKHATTIAVAMMSALVVGNLAPALAHGNVHAKSAHNADTVDGFHAVKAKTSKQKRRGKLVATSPATGLLPNNIIKKAPDANRLDGLDSTAFAAATHTHDAADINDGPGSGLDADTLDGKSSGDFVERTATGLIYVQTDVSDWDLIIGSGSATESLGIGEKLVTSNSASGNATLRLHPEIPVALYGKDLQFYQVELCYDAHVDHLIEEVKYRKVTNSNGSAVSGTMTLNATDRNDDACRVYTMPDQGLSPETTPVFEVDTAWDSTSTTFRIQRMTLAFVPTNADTPVLTGPPN